MSNRILGISAFYHDSAAALLVDGVVVAAAHEERFTRKKQDPGFPLKATRFCLEYGGLSLDEIDAVVFYDKPLLKFERLLETYLAFAPRGLRSFLSAIPVWLKEKLFLKKLIFDELKHIDPELKPKDINLLFSDHHLSHAASAFYPSPFEEAAILTLDGVGEWATASISKGSGTQVELLRELKFPHSLGLLYSAFTYFLGFRVNSGEYKLMGLSPYGDIHSNDYKRFKTLIKEELIDIKDDGSLGLNQRYFNYAAGLRMVHDKKWESLFGFPKREPESELKQIHCDLALAIQHITEEVVLKMAKTARELTGMRYLCLAGGVALNCVANGKLLRSKIFEDIWIQPAAGDAGGALGAAYAAYHLYYNQPRIHESGRDQMQGSYLGPEFSDLNIKMMARRHKAVYEYHSDFQELCDRVAQLIDQGKVIGWFQGRMEWGPRALGNRSILGDARNEEMQKRLNVKIKFRESFRPFAPSVLHEDASTYFNLDVPSPYMLLITNVQTERQNPRPTNYDDLSLRERLYHVRSDIPAITHLDYSARVQTVHQETNPRYHQLLSAFKKRTGYGLVVNTSFNVRGEPIVCTPNDAYTCFMRTDMDYLVVGNFLFEKTKQPEWTETHDWRSDYPLD